MNRALLDLVLRRLVDTSIDGDFDCSAVDLVILVGISVGEEACVRSSTSLAKFSDIFLRLAPLGPPSTSRSFVSSDIPAGPSPISHPFRSCASTIGISFFGVGASGSGEEDEEAEREESDEERRER